MPLRIDAALMGWKNGGVLEASAERRIWEGGGCSMLAILCLGGFVDLEGEVVGGGGSGSSGSGGVADEGLAG